MKLHEAIEKLILQSRRAMTANEIAQRLNQNKWYAKGDGSPIKPGQITARVNEYPLLFQVDRMSRPLTIGLPGNTGTNGQNKLNQPKAVFLKKNNIRNSPPILKFSFPSVSDSKTKILALGSLLGDESLAKGEYYANPQNRFWKVIAGLAGQHTPLNYEDKKRMLLESNMGIWDVAHSAERKGSLDAEIKNEQPNDLEGFMEKHPHLHTIVFNGLKAEKMFKRFFLKKPGLRYVLLPSTSSAYTSMNVNKLSMTWSMLLEI